MDMEKEYKEGDTIYLLMDAASAAALANDWMEEKYECDLLIRRSKKNKGCVVVETKNTIWAARIVKWFRPKKVTFVTK